MSYYTQRKRLHQNRMTPTLTQPTQVNYSKYSVVCLLFSLCVTSLQLGELRSRTHGYYGKVGKLS